MLAEYFENRRGRAVANRAGLTPLFQPEPENSCMALWR